MDNPLVWLNKVVAKVYGESLGLTVVDFFDSPQALVCESNDGRRVLFSPASPDDIRRLKKAHKNKLSRVGNAHPLTDLPRSTERVEISILNGGILFDLELPLAWKIFKGSDMDQPVDKL